MNQSIRQAAVIGSGVMGGGIAALLASAGIQTLLLDIVSPDLDEEDAENPAARNRLVQAGFRKMTSAAPPLLMHPGDADRIRIGNLEDDMDRLSACDWIVEAVVENPAVKKELFARIDAVRKPDAVVSSNTSGIPLKAITDGRSAAFRRHFLGTHFFNPARYMRLLEIVPGADTLPEVVRRMERIAERDLGKGVVRAKDTANFIGNRIGIHGIALALAMLAQEGIGIAAADALFGRPMGRPRSALFKTCDIVGVDVISFVAANTFHMAPADEQRALFDLPSFVGGMIARGLLGDKVGAGFYKKERGPDGETRRLVIDPVTLAYVPALGPDYPCLAAAKKAKTLPERIRAIVYGQDTGARFAWKVTAGSLLYAANRIPEISDTIVDIDNAMRWGYHFDLGPFETWDAIGLRESVARMDAEKMAVPECIRRMQADGVDLFYKTEGGKTYFYDLVARTYRERTVPADVISLAHRKAAGAVAASCSTASLVDLGEGVYCCAFHGKMNAIDAVLIEFLHQSVAYVQQHGAGLVVGNQAEGVSGIFSAGADLAGMAGAVMQGRLDALLDMVRRFQGAVCALRYAPFPVVAAPYGLTLGGGCEVCLGADRMVAHAELYMGLVETGVGLLPGGCGCLNLWRKVSTSVCEAVNGLDMMRFFEPVLMTIALAKVSTSAADARAMGFLGPCDRIVFNREHLIAEAKKEVLRMVQDGYAPPVKRKIKVVGDAAGGIVDTGLNDMRQGGLISEYDAFLTRRLAHILSGGDVRYGTEVEEEVLLTLEQEAFLDLVKEKKTHARVEHMLRTGKPLRN